MFIQVLGAFFAVTAFAIIFNASRKFLPYCGLVGAGGWLAYLVVVGVTSGGFMGVFIAALLVALLSHILARIFKSPVTVFLIPGILPLVPGVGMFRIVYYMVVEDSASSVYYFYYTLQSAGAIAIAIFIMDTIFRIAHFRWKKA